MQKAKEFFKNLMLFFKEFSTAIKKAGLDSFLFFVIAALALGFSFGASVWTTGGMTRGIFSGVLTFLTVISLVMNAYFRGYQVGVPQGIKQLDNEIREKVLPLLEKSNKTTEKAIGIAQKAIDNGQAFLDSFKDIEKPSEYQDFRDEQLISQMTSKQFEILLSNCVQNVLSVQGMKQEPPAPPPPEASLSAHFDWMYEMIRSKNRAGLKDVTKNTGLNYDYVRHEHQKYKLEHGID